MTNLKKRWSKGDVTLGAWCMIPSSLTAEALGKAGFDWVLIDMQHVATAVLPNAKVAPLRISQGFQMVSITTDISALSMISRSDLETVRSSIAKGDTNAG
ncbi:MAG: hypothetical protein ACXWLO_02150 [Rhizomicrobium sp.]